MYLFLRSKTFITVQNLIIRKPSFSSLHHKFIKRNVRLFCDKTYNDHHQPDDNQTHQTNNNRTDEADPSLSSKYDVFKESDSPILLDVFEEKLQLESKGLNTIHQEQSEFFGLNLQRGVHGVFDIEDLVDLLRRDKAEDIFVAVLPPEAKYVDYIVVVTARSRRHMTALSEMVRRVFKKKRLTSDAIPRIEGETSTEWMALDLGNIALHIFSHSTRSVYDLESLWSVGSEYDPLINAPEDSLISLLKKHEISFSEVKNNKGELL